MRNNHAFISFTILFILVNLGLFVARFYEYWNFKNYDYSRNWWIIFARACGQGLNFTSMFILVLMLRHSITKLREMGLAVILPLDRHIYFHKVTGRLIVVYSLIHTVAHLGNLCKASEFWYFLSKNPSKHCFHEFFRLSWQSEIFCFENIFFFVYFTDQNVLNTPNEFLLANGIDPNEYVIGGNLTAVDWLFTNRPHYFGLIPGWANPTGVSVLVVLLVMSVCSMKWVRKGGYFEVFYFSHLLYVIYWVLLIFHAPNFWKWFIGPCVAFLIEKIFRMARSLSDEGKTWVTMGVVLPSKVVRNKINNNHATYLLLKVTYIYQNRSAWSSGDPHTLRSSLVTTYSSTFPPLQLSNGILSPSVQLPSNLMW